MVGELVLRMVVINNKGPEDEKLCPNWEGSYKIIKLADNHDSKQVPRLLNSNNLIKFYQ